MMLRLLIAGIALLAAVALATPADAECIGAPGDTTCTRLYLTNVPSTFNIGPQGAWEWGGGRRMEFNETPTCLEGSTCPENFDEPERDTDVTSVHVVSGVTEEINGIIELTGELCCLLGVKQDNLSMDATYRIHAYAIGYEGDVRSPLLVNQLVVAHDTATTEWPQPERSWQVCTSIPDLTPTLRDRIVIEIGAYLHNNSGADYFARVFGGGESPLSDFTATLQDAREGLGFCEFKDVVIPFGPPHTSTPTRTPTGTPPSPTRTPTRTNTPTPTNTGFAKSFVVNVPYNCDDGGIGDGFCSAVQCGDEGECSLRAAIQECNVVPSGLCEIQIDVGTPFILSDLADSGGSCPAGACGGAGCVVGDLPEITHAILMKPANPPGDAILGPGSGNSETAFTIELRQDTTRFVSIGTGGSLELQNVHVLDSRNKFQAADSGALFYNDGGTLILDGVYVQNPDNSRPQSDIATGDGGRGGAIYNAGTTHLEGGTILKACKSNWGACIYNTGLLTAFEAECLDPVATGMDLIYRAGTFEFPRACYGGANDGLPCTGDIDCPDGDCRTSSGTCTGGNICLGGANEDEFCQSDGDCPGGTCGIGSTICTGGANDNQPCQDDGDCPDGECSPECLSNADCDSAHGGYCSGGGIGWGDTGGGGGCIANFRPDGALGLVVLERFTSRLSRARLGMGGGWLLNGTHDFEGPEGFEGGGGDVWCTNCTLGKNRSRLTEGGLLACYGPFASVNLSHTTIDVTQSAKRSSVVLYPGCDMTARYTYIGGHNLSEPSSGFEVCLRSALGSIAFGSDGSSTITAAYSRDDGCSTVPCNISPPRYGCGGGFESIGPNANLQPIGDYGDGAVETIKPGPGSLLRNAGMVGDCNDTGGNPVTTDARGLPRPVDGACDIGSWEEQ